VVVHSFQEKIWKKGVAIDPWYYLGGGGGGVIGGKVMSFLLLFQRPKKESDEHRCKVAGSRSERGGGKNT